MRPCTRRPGPSRFALALVASLACASFARAADIYVLDALLERDGVESVSPTFIVTPGERALLAFDGERELDIAMTLTPRAAGAEGADAFELQVELVDGVELHSETVPVSLAETVTIDIAGRVVKVLVRVQEALDESAPAAAPASDGG